MYKGQVGNKFTRCRQAVIRQSKAKQQVHKGQAGSWGTAGAAAGAATAESWTNGAYCCSMGLGKLCQNHLRTQASLSSRANCQGAANAACGTDAAGISVGNTKRMCLLEADTEQYTSTLTTHW